MTTLDKEGKRVSHKYAYQGGKHIALSPETTIWVVASDKGYYPRRLVLWKDDNKEAELDWVYEKNQTA